MQPNRVQPNRVPFIERAEVTTLAASRPHGTDAVIGFNWRLRWMRSGAVRQQRRIARRLRPQQCPILLNFENAAHGFLECLLVERIAVKAG